MEIVALIRLQAGFISFVAYDWLYLVSLLKSNSPRKWSKVGNEKFEAPFNFCVEVGYLGG